MNDKPESAWWVNFDERSPDPGEEIEVHKISYFKGIWNGDEITKGTLSPDEFLGSVKSYWRPIDK